MGGRPSSTLYTSPITSPNQSLPPPSLSFDKLHPLANKVVLDEEAAIFVKAKGLYSLGKGKDADPNGPVHKSMFGTPELAPPYNLRRSIKEKTVTALDAWCAKQVVHSVVVWSVPPPIQF
jgi:hypothetical protein